MMHIRNLSKSFGGIKAVNDCSFKIAPNKITGVIGPNGAGKTTIFDLITGLIEPDHGSIIFKNRELELLPTASIANLGIARTFQHVRLFKHLTLREHLYMAMDHHDTRLFRNIFFPQKNTSSKEQRAQDILKHVGLHKPLDVCASELSYGQRKLLDLAMALVKPHSLLLLDEPVAGVNPHVREHIKTLLLELKQQGATIVVIEHDMNFVMDICDTIIVLDAGSLLVEGPPQKIKNDSRVLEAYLGE